MARAIAISMIRGMAWLMNWGSTVRLDWHGKSGFGQFWNFVPKMEPEKIAVKEYMMRLTATRTRIVLVFLAIGNYITVCTIP